MKYNKPEVVVLASAANAVRASDTVAQVIQECGSPTGVYALSCNAYEAGE